MQYLKTMKIQGVHKVLIQFQNLFYEVNFQNILAKFVLFHSALLKVFISHKILCFRYDFYVFYECVK